MCVCYTDSYSTALSYITAAFSPRPLEVGRNFLPVFFNIFFYLGRIIKQKKRKHSIYRVENTLYCINIIPLRYF